MHANDDRDPHRRVTPSCILPFVGKHSSGAFYELPLSWGLFKELAELHLFLQLILSFFLSIPFNHDFLHSQDHAGSAILRAQEAQDR